MATILVLGLGQTGQSVIRFLQAQGWSFAMADTRAHLPQADQLRQQYPDASLHLGPVSVDFLNQFAQIVVSPGIDPIATGLHALSPAVEIIGDIELFARHLARFQPEVPVVAITGSNGKSTVTELLAAMARQAGVHVAVGGNLGPPALDLLAHEVELYVLELSSFQLETTHTLSTRVATILNISPDHLDRYADMEAYRAAKQRIYRHCQRALVNADDPQTLPQQAMAADQIIRFGCQADADWSLAAGQLRHCGQALLPVSELAMLGSHNQANALAALALGAEVDLPLPVMLATLRQFTGLAHRCQWVAHKAGADWINDSKGTNVGATLAAIAGFDSVARLLLLAGGDAKGASFEDLAQALSQRDYRVFCYGRDADKLVEVLPAERVQRSQTLAEAVSLAAEECRQGDLVLLSPACASLDQFANYQARGQHFIELVRALP